MGRQVRKGEKGLAILAPNVYRVEDEETGEKRTQIKGWRLSYVWDISQTDGDPLPEAPMPVLVDGAAPVGMWDDLAKMVADEGFALAVEDPGTPGANGSMSRGDMTVRVRPGLAEAQSVKTLTHELAHALLKHGDDLCHDPRSQREVEAESVAYMVCGAMGLDTSGYSFPYVAHWAAQGKRTEVVEETATRVVTVARQILDGLQLSEAGDEVVAA